MKVIIFKKIGKKSYRNILSLALSLLYAHLWYDEVELYTDELGYNIFKDFPIVCNITNKNNYRDILQEQDLPFMYFNNLFINLKPIIISKSVDYFVSLNISGNNVNYLYVNNIYKFNSDKSFDSTLKIREDFTEKNTFMETTDSLISNRLTVDEISTQLKHCFNFWYVYLKKIK